MSRVITFPLQENLIERLADRLQGKELERQALVFGGRRPALFLKQALAKHLGKPCLSPKFFTLEEFVDRLLPRTKSYGRISNLDAAYRIYHLIRERYPSILRGRKEFPRFLPWAREILSFIEELDLETISAERLAPVEKLARIGFDADKKINLLLKHLGEIREAFHRELLMSGSLTKGLRHQLAAANAGKAELAEFEEITFCDLFFLHQTEKEMIAALLERQLATLIFQGEESDWPILKSLSEYFKTPIGTGRQAKPQTPITIKAGFDLHSQVCLARESLKRAKDQEDCLIVLPDEEALIPLLSEISGLTKSCNVSMGYPLKRSSFYSLLELIFQAQLSKKDNSYYARDYLKVLAHPLAKNLGLFEEPAVMRILVHKIEEALLGELPTELSGLAFLTLAQVEKSEELILLTAETLQHLELGLPGEALKAGLKEAHHLLFSIFSQATSLSSLAAALDLLLAKLLSSRFFDLYPINNKLAQNISELISEYKRAAFADENFPPEELYSLFLDDIGGRKIRFSGTPLSGLQVLGLLETRSLNFGQVIVLNCNEGTLPGSQPIEPLIPAPAKLALGLKTADQTEEIERYHFTRLLAGAGRATLIYAENDRNERSRFLEMLVWEEEKRAGKIGQHQLVKGAYHFPKKQTSLEFHKPDEVIKALTEQTYSASSLNTYLHCPLKFYYKYVLRLKEKGTFSDEAEASEIGNLFHHYLEKVYQPFLGSRPPSPPKGAGRLFDLSFDQFFAKKLQNEAFLLKAVAKHRLESFWKNEERRELNKIIGLEKELKGEIEVAGKKIQLTARLDRVDQLTDGSSLIIDYKTGSADKMPSGKLAIMGDGPLSREFLRDLVRSYQLPLYIWLSMKEHPLGQLNAALYYLRDSRLAYFFKSPEADKETIMNNFNRALLWLLGEILDQSKEFKADAGDPGFCRICPYSLLCR